MKDECKHAEQNERNVAVVLRAKEDLVVQARILGNMQICWVCRNVALRCAPLMVVAHGILRQEYPMPAPLRRGDVRVKVKALGICGSVCSAAGVCLGIFVTPIMLAGDVHYWTHGSIGPFVLKAPMVCVYAWSRQQAVLYRRVSQVIGHESAGVVVAVGDGVDTLSVRACVGACRFARGAPTLCARRSASTNGVAWHGVAGW